MSRKTAPRAMSAASLPAADFKNYGLALGAVQRALDEAISMLLTQARRAADPDEGNRIAVAAGDLQETRQEVDRAVSAFLAGTGQVIPPSAQDVLTLQEIADDLDKMIAVETTANAIIKAATNVINLWKSTRPKQAEAVA